MPTYEYRCSACRHEFEQFQKMTDDPITVCPECGGAVEKLIGMGGGIIFKGPGFHATDYTAQGTGTRCGRESTCCGKATPCDVKPCES
ncbi:MAG TPA: zinc ribbon domain-containing protein [Deltaproteobacteria bacterium]|nr:zinc ribbon domain-containing protein [Deltaproteobacteria bacterium]